MAATVVNAMAAVTCLPIMAATLAAVLVGLIGVIQRIVLKRMGMA